MSATYHFVRTITQTSCIWRPHESAGVYSDNVRWNSEFLVSLQVIVSRYWRNDARFCERVRQCFTLKPLQICNGTPIGVKHTQSIERSLFLSDDFRLIYVKNRFIFFNKGNNILDNKYSGYKYRTFLRYSIYQRIDISTTIHKVSSIFTDNFLIS